MGGQTVRSGSGVAINSSSRQCADDGMVFYRSPNGVILTGGLNGLLAPQYFRFILRLRRDPALTRRILRGRTRPVWAGDSRHAMASGKDRPMSDSDERHSPSAITRTDAKESLGASDQKMGGIAATAIWKCCAISPTSLLTSAGWGFFIFRPLASCQPAYTTSHRSCWQHQRPMAGSCEFRFHAVCTDHVSLSVGTDAANYGRM